MVQFLKSRARSFQYAFSGWHYVIRTQQNAWIHALAGVIVVILGLWLKLTRLEWAVVVIAIALVWTAEFINTALEVVVDLASPKEHQLAKVSKDVGAAGVFTASLCALVIGLLILAPPLWERITLIFSR